MSIVRRTINNSLKNLDKIKSNDKLFQAVKNSDFEIVKKALTPENINNCDKHGLTLLHHAVKILDIEMVKLLIDNKADTNIKNNAGYTALHLVMYENKSKQIPKIINILLQNGADINLKCDNGHSPLYLAIFSGYKITRMLLRYTPNVTDIELDASKSLKSDYIKNLIKLLYDFQIKELILMSNLKTEMILLDDDFIMKNILEFL